MKPVLLLGHDRNEGFGLAPATLTASGIEVLRHYPGDPLPSIGDVSGLIVFGGEMNVDMTERYPFLAAERELLAQAVATDVPVLGICLGAQMLARAMDRKVYPADVREIGFNVLHVTDDAGDDPLFSAFHEGDRVFHWHEDTFELPEGATLLATGDEVHLQGFRIGDRAWGVQFHFEVDRAELEFWLDLAGDEGVQAWGKSREQVLAEADQHLETQEARGRAVFDRFGQIVSSRAR